MFTNKNIVVGDPSNSFTELYVDMLINKCDFNPNDIVFISLKNIIEHPLKKYSVDTYLYNECDVEGVSKCKTLTFISINKSNGFFIKKLFDYTDSFIDKTYIHLTDDEVARWLSTTTEFGTLRPTKSNNVDENVIDVLSKVKNFIAPEAYFKEKVELILKRDDLKFIDGRDAFKSLPSSLWDTFETLYRDPTKYTAPEKSIFIGAKRGVFSLTEVVSIIKCLKKEKVFPNFKCLIFTYKKKRYFRVMLDLYLSYLRHVQGCNIDVSYPTATNAITYNALIMSCSHLIIQGRGSMSTARSYLSMGRGVVHVKESSPNFFELTDAEGINIGRYNSFQNLAKNIKSEVVNVNRNKEIMLSRFEQKYNNLKEIYKC
ncbi:hypothetical protein [Psychromonas sp. Urea-02u-13]|uniref:hypothetical protein n=1 Tax=Psychromonas sp. Urea-02u-13 TaxID=2058326 RepID=UPI000C336618|nr:hypothetical protein [Psychromonas sp. Urea-02u-13]PKG38102.1 hypothetical protein CXF74_15565 [Psychromonas sp. Urea-02u-13]